MTTTDVRKQLRVDSVSVRHGVFTVRRGFFYRHGYTSAQLADVVKAALPSVTVLDHGEVWKPFRGGASVAQQSHWYVTFTVPEDNLTRALRHDADVRAKERQS